MPIGFSIDETRGIRDPRGMLAHRFGAELHLVSADLAACRNLMLAIERCHLDIEAMVASPYVAALSTLAGDEADVGAAVVDLGAGTTTMAVFSNGRFIHADGFALGGNHITQDLARGTVRQPLRCRANQDALWQCADRWRGRTRHDRFAARRR